MLPVINRVRVLTSYPAFSNMAARMSVPLTLVEKYVDDARP